MALRDFSWLFGVSQWHVLDLKGSSGLVMTNHGSSQSDYCDTQQLFLFHIPHHNLFKMTSAFQERKRRVRRYSSTVSNDLGKVHDVKPQVLFHLHLLFFVGLVPNRLRRFAFASLRCFKIASRSFLISTFRVFHSGVVQQWHYLRVSRGIPLPPYPIAPAMLSFLYCFFAFI